jgi:hypothetical protein
VQETNGGMRTRRNENGGKPPGCDGEDRVEHGVYGMSRVTLHVKVGALAGEDRFLPCRRYAGRGRPPSKLGR